MRRIGREAHPCRPSTAQWTIHADTTERGSASGQQSASNSGHNKAPEGYDLYKPAKTFTAGPGAPITVTVTNAKTATTTKPTPSEKPNQAVTR